MGRRAGRMFSVAPSGHTRFTGVMFQKIWRNATRMQSAYSLVGGLLTRAAPLLWVLLFSNGQVVKTEKNFAVAPSAKRNRPSESGQAKNERNEGQHYLLK